MKQEKYETKNNFPAIAPNPQWNSGWDGKCEWCGCDYNISFVQVLSQYQNQVVESGRRIEISVASRGYRVIFDYVESLSGIEIEITSFGKLFKEKTERIFISTNELKHIISMLEDSPILEQFDWGEDWT